MVRLLRVSAAAFFIFLFLSLHAYLQRKKTTMLSKKKVLIVGLDPYLLDFSADEYKAFPGLNADKIMAGTHQSITELEAQGYDASYCFTDLGETAEQVLQQQLAANRYDAILIGAGLRVPPARLLLFERLLNVIHSKAPDARICFNASPADNVAAVGRWLA